MKNDLDTQTKQWARETEVNTARVRQLEQRVGDLKKKLENEGDM